MMADSRRFRKFLMLMILWGLINRLAALTSRKFRLVSWNLLAPVYATPEKFPRSNADDLKWSFRQPRILSRLKDTDADVLFLQEVQIDLWEELYSELQSRGYNGILQEVARGHPIANAVLVRDGFAEIVAHESRSRVLIVILDCQGRHLYLANVHLDAGYGHDKDETRFNQIQSLMKRLYKHVQEIGSKEPCIVIAGDFNMRSNNAVYHLLQTGTLPDNQSVTDRVVLPQLPLLPLFDAYQQQPPTPGPVRMTYTGGAVLDYMWISKYLRPVETWQSHPDAANELYANWPSDQHPSDHLPIGAWLAFSRVQLCY